MPTWLNQEVLYTYSVPFFIVVILAEVFYSHRADLRLYRRGDTLQNLYFAILNIVFDMLMKTAAFFMMGWAYKYHVGYIENVWLYWLALFLLQDFAYYVQHYVDHRSRLFWAAHVTHHSSDLYNISTGFRSSVFQPLYRYFYFMPIAFLGFKPLDIMFCYAAVQIYGTLVHTQTVRKMGLLEYFMVTPSHHRVHHASNVAYLDRNMGMFLIVWDRLFGTFKKEDPNEPVRFGIVTPLTDAQIRNPITCITHEFEAIFADATQPNLTLAQRLKYIFGEPGWSHDGSKQTSKEMQAALKSV